MSALVSHLNTKWMLWLGKCKDRISPFITNTLHTVLYSFDFSSIASCSFASVELHSLLGGDVLL